MSTAAEHGGLAEDDQNLVQAQYQVSGTIYGSDNPAEVLESLFKFVGSAFSYAHLAFIDTEPSRLQVAAEADSTGVHTTAHFRQLSEYPAYDTLAAVEMLYIEDVRNDTFLTDAERQHLLEQHVHAVLLVPLLAAQRLVGLLMFSNGSPVSISPARLRALRSLVDQAAVVFENQRLLRDMQANAIQLSRQVRVLQAVNKLAVGGGTFSDEKALLDFTIREMTTSMDADHGGLMMFDPEIIYGTVMSEHPSHGTEGVRLDMRGNALMNSIKDDPSRPFIVYDVEHDARVTPETLEVFRSAGIKSIMMVPIVMEGRLIASAGLDLYTSERQFTPEMIELAQTMGAQLAIGLQNLRLLTDAQRRADQLQRIATFSQSVQVTLDVASLLNIMVSESRQMLPLDRMTVALFDANRQQLRAVARHENGETQIDPEGGAVLPLQGTLIADVWETQQALYVADTEELPEAQRSQAMGMRSLLIAPIRSRGQLTGSVQVGSTNPYSYSETDVALFQQMIAQFAVALQNSEAYSQSQRAAKNQALVNEITAHLQRNSDVERMMEVALEELGKALGARRARVRLSTHAEGSTIEVRAE